MLYHKATKAGGTALPTGSLNADQSLGVLIGNHPIQDPGPLQAYSVPGPVDDAVEFRQFIAEHLELARLYADMGVKYAEVADDLGLEYSIRKLVGYCRAGLDVLNDLRAEKARRAQR